MQVGLRRSQPDKVQTGLPRITLAPNDNRSNRHLVVRAEGIGDGHEVLLN